MDDNAVSQPLLELGHFRLADDPLELHIDGSGVMRPSAREDYLTTVMLIGGYLIATEIR